MPEMAESLARSWEAAVGPTLFLGLSMPRPWGLMPLFRRCLSDSWELRHPPGIPVLRRNVDSSLLVWDPLPGTSYGASEKRVRFGERDGTAGGVEVRRWLLWALRAAAGEEPLRGAPEWAPSAAAGAVLPNGG